MQKKLFHRSTFLFIAVALTALVLLPISSQASTVSPAGGDLGALGNGDAASFAEVLIDQGTNIATEFEFVYEGTGAIFVVASAPRLVPNGDPVFGIDNFRFTVGTSGTPIWDSSTIQPDLVGRIITAQELADEDIAMDTTLIITVLGEAVGSFTNSYSGNVGVVPIPAAAWLLGAGLIGLLALRRRSQS
jgi:hypothetical protein